MHTQSPIRSRISFGSLAKSLALGFCASSIIFISGANTDVAAQVAANGQPTATTSAAKNPNRTARATRSNNINDSATAAAAATASSAKSSSSSTSVGVTLLGQQVQVDSTTGQLRPLTPDEARRLAAGMQRYLNRSTEGLQVTQLPNGGEAVNIEDRFENFSVAKRNPDGTIATECIATPEELNSFLGIKQTAEANANRATLKSNTTSSSSSTTTTTTTARHTRRSARRQRQR